MRLLLCCLALAYGCDPRDSNERLDARPNPNLSVEPIVIDAGTRPARVKRASIGDHRRREDEDAKEARRDKARRKLEAQRAEAEAARKEAERRQLTDTPLQVTPPRW